MPCVRSLFGRHLLQSFNGPEPGGPELMTRKWKREQEGEEGREVGGEREGEREREREKERQTWGSKLWWSKGALLAETQSYISLVRWLFRYYIGWNFINSHNMDSLIYTRSLTQKRVTEGDSYMSHPMTSVLGTACCFIRSQNRNW